jgi:hypothetical protein
VAERIALGVADVTRILVGVSVFAVGLAEVVLLVRVGEVVGFVEIRAFAFHEIHDWSLLN